MHAIETERLTAGRVDAGGAPGWLVSWVLQSARRRHEERRAAAGLLAMGDRLLRDAGMSRLDAERIAGR